MSLTEGIRLGAYEITGHIGAGGMGEVYRATDTKLSRDVAIKTLPAALASDKDRLARFEREATLLAALHHPHIASVFSLDEHEGTLYLAMELVEGETLEEKLKPGALPVEDALRLAFQIAEALEAAHDKGVVHRDLKPANVMVTKDGVVKVLDFGLAKAFSEDPDGSNVAQSPALSVAMTQQGLVLGTAGYMSPEQASGQQTDQRADIWAFGVVLYEMLTGLPLFSGESVPHILADVLKSEPDWNRLPGDLHPRLRLMLKRCLTKKPKNRYSGIADARVDIEYVLANPEGSSEPTIAQDEPRRGIAAILLAGAAAAIVAALIAAVSVWFTLRPLPQQLNLFSYSVPSDHVFRGTGRPVLAVSPDGRHFAYNTEDGLYIRPMDALAARLVAGTESALTNPIFSADSQSLAYQEGGQLKRIAISGGAAVTVAPEIENPFGMSWGPDGSILIAQSDGIYRVAATGGRAELVIPPHSDEERLHGPTLLPDGEHILFAVQSGTDWDSASIVAQSMTTGERTVLIEGGTDPRFIPSGHIVYAFEDTLYGWAFDADTLTISGGSVPLAQGIVRARTNFTGAANFGVTDNGSLIYLTGGTDRATSTLVWVDRDGTETPIDIPSRAYAYAQLSPDESLIALDARDDENDIFVFDLERENLQRLTIEPDQSRSPAWNTDGDRIAFALGAAATSLQWQVADGSSSAVTLLERSQSLGQVYPSDFTPDGSALIFSSYGSTGVPNIGILPLEESGEPQLIIATEFDEKNATVSPDSRWIAFESNQSNRFEIYVRPFPNIDDAIWQVSREGGTRPLWSEDGSELFFLDATNGPIDAVMSAPIIPGDTFNPGVPVEVFAGNYRAPLDLRGAYDVSADGQRFLMIKSANSVEDGETDVAQIVIVQNWIEELKRLVPTD